MSNLSEFDTFWTNNQIQVFDIYNCILSPWNRVKLIETKNDWNWRMKLMRMKESKWLKNRYAWRKLQGSAGIRKHKIKFNCNVSLWWMLISFQMNTLLKRMQRMKTRLKKKRYPPLRLNILKMKTYPLLLLKSVIKT